MRQFLSLSVLVALLATGCGRFNNESSSLRYHDAESGLTFLLPSSWQGYSVSIEQWEGTTYSPALDKTIVVGHGRVITLRHPQWRANTLYQDIPILVFTRAQWDDGIWPSLYAGGTMGELWHNQNYVFAMSSRYNADQQVKGWKEVNKIVEQNCNSNKMARLYPE